MHETTKLITATRLALAFIPATVTADDKAIATQIEALGGKVTMKDGVATQLGFIDCTKLDEAAFQLIGQLTHLKSLTLYHKCLGLDDKTRVPLLNLKELELLGTDVAQFSDDGLKQLTAFQELKSAAIFHTSFGNKAFTGVGFGHLKGCPKLTSQPPFPRSLNLTFSLPCT